ncbi:MAG: hypothetical protein WKF59_09565 [Chitinophagaceae bacterium]
MKLKPLTSIQHLKSPSKPSPDRGGLVNTFHNESIPRICKARTCECTLPLLGEAGRELLLYWVSGPNRIGQGIEFDYCCVHGLLAIKECGYEAIMINCNPETVSTDFDIADKLYFEPVFWEHIWEIIEHEKPCRCYCSAGRTNCFKACEKTA